MYILPEALGTRQELAGTIKHHSVAELKGQVASLLSRYPNGVLLSVLRNLFREHFSHDIDEREYGGEYTSLEDLITKALPEVARLEKIPQVVSDLLILPVIPDPNQTTDSTSKEKEIATPLSALPLPSGDGGKDGGSHATISLDALSSPQGEGGEEKGMTKQNQSDREHKGQGR